MGGGIGACDPTAGDACARHACTLCQTLASCDPADVADAFNDIPTCAARLRIECALRLSEPGTSITESWIDGCTAAVTSCDLAYAVVATPFRVPGCEATPGTLPIGSPCRDHAQCESGACSGGVGVGCGACVAGSGAPTFVPPVPKDAACGATTQERCSLGLTCTAGVCTEPKPIGTACGSDLECDRAHLQFCDDSTKTCRPIPQSIPGQPCGSTPPTHLGFCYGNCGPTGLCESYPADGEPCTNASMSEVTVNCVRPAICVNDRCTLPKTCPPGG